MTVFKSRILVSAIAIAVMQTACGGGSAASIPAPVATVPPSAATPTPTPSPVGTARLTQDDARIGPCMNMANHLEANPTEGAWGRAINDRDMAEIAAAGFETIRLPVRWSTHAGSTPPYTIDPAWMARVDEVVAQARAAGLRVILNDHHYDQLFITPDTEQARFIAIWRQVADHFKDADDMVWFELLNEPHNQINDSNLLSILEPALAVVRATNPTRPIVVGGENWSGINSLATLTMPDDPYLIATFHYYDPFPFTHQGASWPAEPQPLGATFGSAADRAELRESVRKVRDYMERTGRPLFLGEYGAYDVIPLDQRAAYYGAVSSAFREAGVDGCVWGYTNSFAFRDQQTGEWHTELLRAIGL